MNDQQLKSLLKVVECGSFSRAEEALYTSKQALKKQIDSLERETGFQLLVRTHQGVSLTPRGVEFCRSARKILHEMSLALLKSGESTFHGQIIRIENPYHPRLLLENAFIEFSRKFPYIKQQLILRTSKHFVDDIISNRADLAECIYYPELENSGLKYTKLFPLPYKCLMAPDHPLAGQKAIRMEELSGNRIGLLEKNYKFSSHLSERCHSFSLEILKRNDTEDIFNICYNRGVFISKAYFVDFMSPLIAIPLETDIVPIVGILHHKSPSQVVREFLNTVHELYPQ